MTKAEERGKRKEERKPKNLFSFFRFQILSIHTRVVLADLEPETFYLSSAFWRNRAAHQPIRQTRRTRLPALRHCRNRLESQRGHGTL
jgi:hypothetical protein